MLDRRRAGIAAGRCSTPSRKSWRGRWSAGSRARSRRAVVSVERAAVAAVRQGPHHHVRERLHRRQDARITRPRIRTFTLIHEPWFCEKCSTEFGVDPERGLIVNGHVPVKIEEGESPLKRSGKAITIDGAFSEAYGDHGYTLVLEAGPHAAGAAPSFRVGRRGARGRRRHHSQRGGHPRARPATAHGRHRAGRAVPLRDRNARTADRTLSQQRPPPGRLASDGASIANRS